VRGKGVGPVIFSPLLGLALLGLALFALAFGSLVELVFRGAAGLAAMMGVNLSFI
jgi:hypothetical protein